MAMQQQNDDVELSDEYKLMIDKMLDEEANGKAQYISAESIKDHVTNQ